jgi:tetratricopeptide (TPR) repeat protein
MKKLIPLILIVAGVAAYHNSFRGPFIFDDISAIRNNRHIRRLWPVGEALTAPPQTTAAGRPVLALSLALNYAISGLNVWSYHAFNVAIHIAAALTLYGIVRRTLESERLRGRFGQAAPWLALATALIWMVHPLQTSSVTYIIQRAESLMGLFYLLTLCCVIRGWYAGAIAACALGMATKETMVTAPLAVLLYDRAFRAHSFQEIFRTRWKLYAGLAATWLVLAALMATAMRTESVGFGLENIGALDYARTQCGVIAHYVRLAFWPRPLVLDHYWPVAKSWPGVASAAFLLAMLIGATMWAWLRKPELGFLGVWFFLILSPTSSFVPIITEIAAEHRMYLPLAAVAVLVVMGLHALPRLVGVALAGALVAGLSLTTIQRNADYRTELSIWSDTVAKRPNNPRARNNLGLTLAGERKFDQAIEQYSEAVRLEPGFATAHYNLGKTLAGQGKMKEAAAHFTKAVLIKPRFADARVELGIALGEQGKLEEAVAQLSEALRIGPDSANVQYNMGVVLARQGKLMKALESFERAVVLDPGFAPAQSAQDDLRQRLKENKGVGRE